MRKTIIHATGRDGGLSLGSEEHAIHQELIRILNSLFDGEKYQNSENDIVLSGEALKQLLAIVDQEIQLGVAQIKGQKVDVRYYCSYENEKIGIDSSIPEHQRIADLIDISKFLKHAIENHERFRIDYFENITEVERKVMFVLNVKLQKEARLEEIHECFMEVYSEMQRLSISKLGEILTELIGKKMIYVKDGAYYSAEKATVYF